MSEKVVAVEELSGRAMDAAVAEEVMGLQVVEQDGRLVCPALLTAAAEIRDGELVNVGEVPARVRYYSTSIEAAWRVLSEVDWWGWELNGADDLGVVVCYLNPSGTPYRAEAPTAPLAICRAALKAARSA